MDSCLGDFKAHMISNFLKYLEDSETNKLQVKALTFNYKFRETLLLKGRHGFRWLIPHDTSLILVLCRVWFKSCPIFNIVKLDLYFFFH